MQPLQLWRSHRKVVFSNAGAGGRNVYANSLSVTMYSSLITMNQIGKMMPKTIQMRKTAQSGAGLVPAGAPKPIWAIQTYQPRAAMNAMRIQIHAWWTRWIS